MKPKSPLKQTYIPGVCNIGPAERAKRRQSGYIAAAIAVALAAVLIAVNASWGWCLLIFLPASAAASGFLQDAFHFCAGFGMQGIYNVVNSAGVTDNVDQAEFRRKDRQKAQLILALSMLIGAVMAVGFAIVVQYI